MTTPDHDPTAPLKDAWSLYLAMTEDLASEHAHAEYSGVPASVTWGGFSDRIDAAKDGLFGLAGPSDTHRERRHKRHERREIAAIADALDETHQALVRRSDAEVAYRKLEDGVKKAMAAGDQGDLESLDQARDQLSRAHDTLAEQRANLAMRIENLADETGSGLFTPKQ